MSGQASRNDTAESVKNSTPVMNLKRIRLIFIIMILLTFLIVSKINANDNRMRLVVLDFNNETRLKDVAVGKGVSKMLTTSLVNSGEFRVVERGKVLNAILKDSNIHTLKEQGFTIGRTEMDMETGSDMIKVYHFGEIKKIDMDKTDSII